MTSERKKFDVAAKKEILGLLFKNIIIKNQRNARPRSRVAPVFYEPFQKIATKNQFLLEEGEKCDVTTLKRMDDTWRDIYHRLKSILEFIYMGQL